MAKTLKGKITDAITEAIGANMTITFETVPDKRVLGYVTSRSFAKKSPTQRQDLIWKHLDERLTPSERRRIAFIATDTPAEYAAITKAQAEAW